MGSYVLIDLHNQYTHEVGELPRRSKAVVIEAIKISPGAVKLQDLTRERLIEFGRKRSQTRCRASDAIGSVAIQLRVDLADTIGIVPATHRRSTHWIVDDSGTGETILYSACMAAISSAKAWPRGSAICCDLTRPTTTARTHLSVNKDAVVANSTCRWSDFAYAVPRRTSSSVGASLISDGHSYGELDEVTAAMDFLLSDDALFVTSSLYTADGGTMWL